MNFSIIFFPVIFFLGVLFVPLAGLPLNKKRDVWIPLTPKVEGQSVSGDVRLRLLLTDA